MSVPTDEALRVLAHHVGERLRQGRELSRADRQLLDAWLQERDPP